MLNVKMRPQCLLRLAPEDNVLCVTRPLAAGETITLGDRRVTVGQSLSYGAKLAAQAIPQGALVLKYGQPIGTATRDIALGELVHLHNLRSNYLPTYRHETQTAYFAQPRPPAH